MNFYCYLRLSFQTLMNNPRDIENYSRVKGFDFGKSDTRNNFHTTSNEHCKELDFQKTMIKTYKLLHNNENSSLNSAKLENKTVFSSSQENRNSFSKSEEQIFQQTGIKKNETYKGYMLFQDLHVSIFEKTYSFKFCEESLIDFKTIICDEYFISYLDRFIHVRQIRKRDHNILKNQSNKDFINHSYIKERRNTLDCLRIIILFQYQNPREFIYFFSSVLLFTINFRLCFFEPQMERYIKNFKIKTDCNIYEYGFGHRSFVYSDLASTKKILARNVFTKENYTFDDFINYIFNCYENTEESKLEKKEMFIRLFRLTYIEVYSYFKDYILQKNI